MSSKPFKHEAGMAPALSDDTLLVAGGRSPADFDGAVNTPVVRTSTVISSTLAEYEQREGDARRMSYGRHGTATTRSFEEAIALLEHGETTCVLPSGLSADIFGVLPFVAAGDHILVPDNVYWPMRRFCENRLTVLGVETSYYDPGDLASLEAAIRPRTRLIYVESPGSLTFEMTDVPALVAIARRHGLLVAMDNTWATPLYFKPLDFGVDISIQAATKYIVGHSDVLIGTVTANARCAAQLRQAHRDFGMTTSPDDIYLALRGLRTMAVRLERQWHNGLILADWLAARPEVEAVFHPARPEDKGHAIWKRDFSGASGLFGFVLRPFPAEKVAAFVDSLKLFGIGASWGGYESLIMPMKPSAHRSVLAWPWQGAALRIHAGLEDPGDLLADLEQGLARLGA